MKFSHTLPAIILALAASALVACGSAPGLFATPTPSASPTATASPTITPTSTPSSTPTATPLPPSPLMITQMRLGSYPGSAITFEETLPPDLSYDRYIVSYLSEGNKIYAYMTVPRGRKPATGWPVIIFNHGFIPPSTYKTTELYIAYQHGFASHGYIVFRSDYRGHGKSEGVAVGGYGSPAYTVDVLNGMASVERYPDADPNRIGMWGHSMGGQITLRAMVVSRDIKAGVIWGGVVGSYPDLMTYWWSQRNGGAQAPAPGLRGRWRADMETTYGTPDENPQFWAGISPNSYLKDLSGPVQLHHSTTDETVPFILSEILYKEILAVGVPVEFYPYPDDNHDIAGHFNTAMMRSIAFFDRWVKGEQ